MRCRAADSPSSAICSLEVPDGDTIELDSDTYARVLADIKEKAAVFE